MIKDNQNNLHLKEGEVSVDSNFLNLKETYKVQGAFLSDKPGTKFSDISLSIPATEDSMTKTVVLTVKKSFKFTQNGKRPTALAGRLSRIADCVGKDQYKKGVLVDLTDWSVYIKPAQSGPMEKYWAVDDATRWVKQRFIKRVEPKIEPKKIFKK